MDKIDLHAVTYTDDNGDEKNAYDYLMANGNLGVPGGRYGSDTRDCADIAIMLFLVFQHANGDCCIDTLDGCMSSVVNSGDDVCWTILDYQCAFEHVTVQVFEYTQALNPADYFDEDEIAYSRELYSIAYCGEAPHF